MVLKRSIGLGQTVSSPPGRPGVLVSVVGTSCTIYSWACLIEERSKSLWCEWTCSYSTRSSGCHSIIGLLSPPPPQTWPPITLLLYKTCSFHGPHLKHDLKHDMTYLAIMFTPSKILHSNILPAVYLLLDRSHSLTRAVMYINIFSRKSFLEVLDIFPKPTSSILVDPLRMGFTFKAQKYSHL